MCKDAVVKQIDIWPKDMCGVVVECSAMSVCKQQNPDHKPGQPKNCILSVPDHGRRCVAYPEDTTNWLIDQDTTRIKQL